MLGVQTIDLIEIFFLLYLGIMAVTKTTDLKGTRIEKKNVRAKNWFIKLFGSNSQFICMVKSAKLFHRV